MNQDVGRNDEERDLAAFVLRQADDKARAILADAHARAKEIEGEAFTEARRRLERAKRQERARARELSRMAEARMRSRIAGRRREIQAQHLQHLRAELSSVLEEFWNTPPLREVWLRAAVARAKEVFESDGWCIELINAGAGPHANEPDGLFPVDAKILRREESDSGVRIRSGKAVLEATVDAFLARGARVDALLLAALQSRMDEEA